MHDREVGLEIWKLGEGGNVTSLDPFTQQTHGNSSLITENQDQFINP